MEAINAALVILTITVPALIAVISFWYIHLRGPSILCSPINWILIGHINQAILGTDLTFINSGASTGVIKFFYIKLINNSPLKYQSLFLPIKEDFKMEDLIGNKVIDPIETPFQPIIIVNGDGLKKNFLFSSQDENFRFIKGEYEIEVYIQLAGRKKQLRILNEKIIINDNLPEYGNPGNAKKSINYDPLKEIIFI